MWRGGGWGGLTDCPVLCIVPSHPLIQSKSTVLDFIHIAYAAGSLIRKKKKTHLHAGQKKFLQCCCSNQISTSTTRHLLYGINVPPVGVLLFLIRAAALNVEYNTATAAVGGDAVSVSTREVKHRTTRLTLKRPPFRTPSEFYMI